MGDVVMATRADFHVHTALSRCGRSPIEEYAAAVDAGRCGLVGFAEHIDLHPWGGSYRYVDAGRYAALVARWRRRGYPFLRAAEVDYVPGIEGEVARHLARHRYAYAIGSVHTVGDGVGVSGPPVISGSSRRPSRAGVSGPPVISGSSRQLDRAGRGAAPGAEELRGVIEAYHEAAARMVGSGLFGVAGHMGVYRRPFGALLEAFGLGALADDSDRELARLCARAGLIVEVNTSGLFAPCGATLPGEAFLMEYVRAGGRRLTLGSDAHEAAHVCRGFERAAALLLGLGFESVENPAGGAPMRLRPT
jgi:histidinol phosphatase-like PHP family hydrolase